MASFTSVCLASGLNIPSPARRPVSFIKCSAASAQNIQTTPYKETIRRVPLESLHRADFEPLLQKELAVLVVPGFYSQEAAEHGAEGLARLDKAAYANAPEVGKAGNMLSLYEIRGDAEREARYFQEAQRFLPQFRAAFHPFTPPMDKVRLLLDELFPLGALLMNIPRKGKASVGLCRIMHGPVKAHRDKLENDLGMSLEELDRYLSYKIQLAINIYLKVPEQGGELLLWNYDMPNAEFALLSKGTYGIDCAQLPHPDAVYRPAQGDLAFFMPRNLHAITASTGGMRLSQSGFLKYAGDEKPLELWS